MTPLPPLCALCRLRFSDADDPIVVDETALHGSCATAALRVGVRLARADAMIERDGAFSDSLVDRLRELRRRTTTDASVSGNDEQENRLLKIAGELHRGAESLRRASDEVPEDEETRDERRD